MPDSDPPSTPDSNARLRNLPAVIRQPSHGARAAGWLSRTLRSVFGWKPGSVRAHLRESLEAAPDDSGFTADESRMLKNILVLRERRMQDVMVPRADIVAVQQDISLGELLRVFESAGHSRLVVYNDTLDDPIGMVHIRDLVAFMAARAQFYVQRRPSLRAALDLKAIDLAVPLSSTKIMRSILFVPP